MKENYPVEIVEYAKGNHINDQPAFQWWVSYTLKKKDVIISAVKAMMRNNQIKYGLNVPRNMREVKLFDQANFNNAWQDVTNLETATIMLAIDLIEGNRPLPGYTKSSGYLLFDIKMDFILKARWVKDGHLSPDPIESNFAGVVSREIIIMILTYATLIGLDLCATDIC